MSQVKRPYDLKVPVSFPQKTDLSRQPNTDYRQNRSPNHLEFLNFSHVVTFRRRDYGKKKQNNWHLRHLLLAGPWVPVFLPKHKHDELKVCKRLTQEFCFRLRLNVSDLYNDKNHWTSQGNLWWKITGPEQKRARSAQEAQSHPALLKPERANLPPAATSNSLLTLLKNEIFKCPHKTNKSASEKPCLEDRNVWSS